MAEPGTSRAAHAPEVRRHRWLADRSVRTKILASLLAVTLVAAAVGILGLLELDRAQARERQSMRNALQLLSASHAQGLAMQNRLDVAAYAPAGPAERARLLADVGGTDAFFDREVATFRMQTGDPTALAVADGLELRYRTVRDDVLLPLVRANRLAAAASVTTRQLSPPAAQAEALLGQTTGALAVRGLAEVGSLSEAHQDAVQSLVGPARRGAAARGRPGAPRHPADRRPAAPDDRLHGDRGHR